jgi:hypothetical protein
MQSYLLLPSPLLFSSIAPLLLHLFYCTPSHPLVHRLHPRRAGRHRLHGHHHNGYIRLERRRAQVHRRPRRRGGARLPHRADHRRATRAGGVSVDCGEHVGGAAREAVHRRDGHEQDQHRGHDLLRLLRQDGG